MTYNKENKMSSLEALKVLDNALLGDEKSIKYFQLHYDTINERLIKINSNNIITINNTPIYRFVIVNISFIVNTS